MTLVRIVDGVGSSPQLAPLAVFLHPAQYLLCRVLYSVAAFAVGTLGSVAVTASRSRLAWNQHQLLFYSD